jgi:hypothetical protein
MGRNGQLSPVTSVTTLEDLVPDPRNARRHGPRNVGMITDSLHAVGAARSIVIDEDNVILAGNATVDAAAVAGITKVQIVDADGSTIIAVRRTGLSKLQKIRLALDDNRSAELAEGWNADVLTALQADGVPLDSHFTPDELEKLLADGGADLAVTEVDTSQVHDQFWITIRGPLLAQADALHRLHTAMADLGGVEVELGSIPYDEAP